MFCVLYYNIPVHVSSKSRATDHVWESNKFYSRGTEGFAFGKTDANGYNNLVALDSKDVDVLFIGSSHMEAFNVSQDKNSVSLLNKLMNEKNMGLNAYNIGISSHYFARCLNNFADAVSEYDSANYIVIETSNIKPSVDDLQKIEGGTFEKLEASSNSLVVMFQKIPFVRRVYAQLSNIQIGKTKNVDPANIVQVEQNENEYKNMLNDALSKVSITAENNGTKLIIFYHTNLNTDKSGALIEREEINDVTLFRTLCEDNNIIFIDMYDAFAESYNETYHLPHGFSNTAVGEGHLNKYGHEVIARELFELISNLEKSKLN